MYTSNLFITVILLIQLERSWSYSIQQDVCACDSNWKPNRERYIYVWELNKYSFHACKGVYYSYVSVFNNTCRFVTWRGGKVQFLSVAHHQVLGESIYVPKSGCDVSNANCAHTHTDMMIIKMMHIVYLWVLCVTINKQSLHIYIYIYIVWKTQSIRCPYTCSFPWSVYSFLRGSGLSVGSLATSYFELDPFSTIYIFIYGRTWSRQDDVERAQWHHLTRRPARRPSSSSSSHFERWIWPIGLLWPKQNSHPKIIHRLHTVHNWRYNTYILLVRHSNMFFLSDVMAIYSSCSIQHRFRSRIRIYMAHSEILFDHNTLCNMLYMFVCKTHITILYSQRQTLNIIFSYIHPCEHDFFRKGRKNMFVII